MINTIKFEEWKVPNFSEDNMRDLIGTIRNASPPRSKTPILAGTLAGIVIAGAAGLVFLKIHSESDISIAKSLLERELKHNLSLIDYSENSRREYFKEGDAS